MIGKRGEKYVGLTLLSVIVSLFLVSVLFLAVRWSPSDKVLLSPEPGLILKYSFEDLSEIAKGKVIDSSGNGKDGVLTKGTSVDSFSGKGMWFNGDGYIKMSNSLFPSNTSTFTMIAWIKLDKKINEFSRSFPYIASRENYSANEGFYFGTYDQSSPKIGMRIDGGSGVATNYEFTNLGRWTRVAVTYDGTTLKIFENDVLKNSTSVSGKSIKDVNPSMFFGYGWEGSIDEIQIFNVAFTEGELKERYDRNRRMHFTLDSISGSETKDSSANQFTGTVLGAQETDDAVKGDAVSFGGNDFIKTNAIFPIGSEFTVTAWVKPQVSGVKQVIVGNGIFNGSESQIQLSLNADGTIEAGFHYEDNNESWVYLNSRTKVAQNDWTHVAAALENNQIKIYINGQIDAFVEAQSKVPYFSGKGYSLGAMDGPSAQFFHFKGIMDEVRLYSVALTGPQIQSIYDADSPGDSGSGSGGSGDGGSSGCSALWSPQYGSCIGGTQQVTYHDLNNCNQTRPIGYGDYTKSCVDSGSGSGGSGGDTGGGSDTGTEEPKDSSLPRVFVYVLIAILGIGIIGVVIAIAMRARHKPKTFPMGRPGAPLYSSPYRPR